MSRKKLVNNKKFVFDEEEVLPAPRKHGHSAQSRLTSRRYKNTAVSSKCPVKVEGHSYNYKCLGAGGDGGLENRVVGASSVNIKLGEMKEGMVDYTIGNLTDGPLEGRSSNDPLLDEIVMKLQKLVGAAPEDITGHGEKKVECICNRPVKLIMCGTCGETFPARVRIMCRIHPTDVYLLDVTECRNCRKEKLIEYDLPSGMEAGLKNVMVGRKQNTLEFC